jgi:hypothetical protein
MSMGEKPTAQITKAPSSAAKTAAARVSDRGKVCDRVAGPEPIMCVCMIAPSAGVSWPIVYLISAVLRHSRIRPACLIDKNRIKKPGVGRDLCHVL